MRREWKRLEINSAACARMVGLLENYREGATGMPVKNGSQHCADSLRCLFMADFAGIITPYLTMPERYTTILDDRSGVGDYFYNEEDDFVFS